MESLCQEPQVPIEEPVPTALEAIEHAIMHISWLGQRQFMHLLDRERFRLTLPQFYTLLYLHHARVPCRMSDVAEATHQSAASLTGIIDRLLEKQLVTRTRHERDRRQVMVVVTPRGSLMVVEIKRMRRAQMHAALAHVQEQDIETLLHLLDQVLISMMAALEGESDENSHAMEGHGLSPRGVGGQVDG
jgi:DNA-binding MarR family transcriptional regulator